MILKKINQYSRQFLKSHPLFLIKLKLKQKIRNGLMFYQDHFHCLGLYSQKFGYFSQNGQDFFLDKHIFKGKENGFFIDIGTFAPDFDNATYWFEKNKKWKGLGIEPQIQHVEKWMQTRKNPIIHAAASSESGKANFIVVQHPEVMNYNAWSGIQTSIAQEKMELLPKETSKSLIEVNTVSVTDALSQINVRDIDLVSIDVEGHELEVLKGIDFKNLNIKCLVIENDILPEGDPVIIDFVKSKGYDYIARLTSDDIFIKKH